MANVPIPQEKIGECFVWRDWFQRLSNTVYGDPISGAIAYGKGSNIAFTAQGTAGQVLTSSGAGTPVWATPLSTGTTPAILYGNGRGGFNSVTVGAGLSFLNGTLASTSVTIPVTKTADFTLATTETWVINNKAGSACTVTFPAASLWPGRAVTFKNMQAQLVNSATSNVVPLDGTAAGTAILLDVVGNWATVVSDGTNWVIMQAAPNNILLLE